MNRKRIVLGILVILIFTIIFIFSNENGTESQSVSEGITMNILNIFPKTRNLNQKEKNKIVKKSQFVVRKAAHFTIYLCAGLSVAGFINTYEKSSIKKKILISFFICLLYAISDEIHQLYSTGRSARVFDVFIDSLGSISGILIICMNKIKSNKYI